MTSNAGAARSITDDELHERYKAWIEAHLARLETGHDPMGHLFAIERLARAERSERWDVRRHLEHGSPRQ